MIDLEKMVFEYMKDGYSELFAEARVCQDIVLKAIAKSPIFISILSQKRPR